MKHIIKITILVDAGSASPFSSMSSTAQSIAQDWIHALQVADNCDAEDACIKVECLPQSATANEPGAFWCHATTPGRIMPANGEYCEHDIFLQA